MSTLGGIIELDLQIELHLARLLILISVLTHQKHVKKVDGITKLAKLDFLLRYPVALKRALSRINVPADVIPMELHEWTSVESSMILFKYGPWDKRYRSFLAILESHSLLRIEKERETIFIEITNEGERIAEKLKTRNEFTTYAERSYVIWKYFEKMPAYKLEKLMSEIIPELQITAFGDVISI